MTKQGHEQLEARLKRLKEEELPRIQKAIGAALEMGDVSENAELDAAREEARNTERMIGELEQQFACADIIDASQVPKDAIAIGATVVLEDLKRGGEIDYMLVGEGETRDDRDTVSVTSPLGSSLIGHKAGDEVEFQGPRGALRYKVVSFRYE
jgi:transcription elongation factor GreA